VCSTIQPYKPALMKQPSSSNHVRLPAIPAPVPQFGRGPASYADDTGSSPVWCIRRGKPLAVTPKRDGPLAETDLIPSSRNGLWDRRAKVDRLRAEGSDPYPHLDFPRRSSVATLHEHWSEPGSTASPNCGYRVSGRITAHRKHGKVSFMDIGDQTGSIEACSNLDVLGEERHIQARSLDVGDIVGLEGTLVETATGAPLLVIHQWVLLAKALRPPPRLATRPKRQDAVARELELLAHAPTRAMFEVRARTIRALRNWMHGHGFLEVDTPILQPQAGGALARPFVTATHAIQRELALRISPELYLRRCIVGGFERVYDLGRCFRNEGISARHSPEFTMLEWSMMYFNYRDVADFTEAMISTVAAEVMQDSTFLCEGQQIDLQAPWSRCSLRDAVQDVTGVDILSASTDDLTRLLKRPARPDETWSDAVGTVYSKLVEPTLTTPTIVFDFPIDPLPLVKRHAEYPALGEAFDVVIGGIEIAGGDTELNDPDEQEDRFNAQRERGRHHDAHPFDEDYVRALEYGVAPSAGAGVGIERLLLVLTGLESIRDVVPFPIMRGRR
jgi:lysyl-tRNA synthetase, class II